MTFPSNKSGGEIVLRNKQFCNLSEVVVRAEDTLEDLERKVRQTTILGTLQSTLTKFKYLDETWKINTEEERLLGVSLTGIMDHPILNGSTSFGCDRWDDGSTDVLPLWLEHLRNAAIQTNKEWSDRLGINSSVAITTVKPSGTVSQLVNSASGIHPRFSRFYVRTVRGDNKDPVTKLLKASGVHNEPDISKPDSTTVFSFPIAAPEGCVTVDDVTALDQLELWLTYQRHWCEHNPSITVYVRDHEWLSVGAWVYEHFDEVSGISFLPYSDHVYAQAPYQPITEDEYSWMEVQMPTIDWSRLSEYELTDHTKGTKEMACSAGVCEIVDV